MSGFTSPVQILSQNTVTLSFSSLDRNPDEKKDEHSVVSMSANFDDDPKVGFEGPESRLCGCTLTVTCVWKDAAREVDTCKAECRLHGLIAAPTSTFEGVDDSDVRTFMRVNAVSLMYGKARSLVETISAESFNGKKTLLAIDPYAFLESADEDSSA